MRKYSVKQLLCLFLAGLLFLGFFKADPLNAAEKKIKVTTDPRIELLTVIQWMVGYWPLSEFDFTYRNEISEHFGEYYMHPVLRHYVMLWFVYGFQYEIPYALMLHLSEPPELLVRIPVPKYILDRMGGENNLNDFLDLLRDYAKETKFMEFYEDHKLFYKKHTDAVTVLISEKDYIQHLEDFFGPNQNSYTIILSPLVHKDGYGVKVSNTMYSIIGPSRSEENEPVFTDPDMLAKQIYHEFSQSFIGPLTSQNREEVLRYGKLYDPIMDEMMYSGYPTWELCYTEHLIRSVMNHILVKDLLKEDLEKRKQDDYFAGFIYSEYIFDLFQEYLDNRDIFVNFSDFYPKVLDLLQNLCELPYAPAYLKVVYASVNGVQLSWEDHSKEECGFQVYRYDENANRFSHLSGTLEPDTTYYRDLGVISGATYLYKVSAVGTHGEIYTNTVSIDIPASRPISIKEISINYDSTEKKATFQWLYYFKVDGFKLYEVTGERTLLKTISYEKGPGDFGLINYSTVLDNIPEGKHVYVLTAYVKEGDKDVESLDSRRISIEIKPEE